MRGRGLQPLFTGKNPVCKEYVLRTFFNSGLSRGLQRGFEPRRPHQFRTKPGLDWG
jgi:hypothetical protein